MNQNGNHAFIWLILISCVLVVISGVFAQDGASSTGMAKSITVVMDTNYPPYSFYDEQGNYIGIAVDRWHLWEKKTGIPVTIIPMNWVEAQNCVKNSTYDVIDTITYSDERAKVFDFSKPYFDIETPLFFQTNLSGISDLASARGFVVGMQKGNSIEQKIKDAGITLKEYGTYEEVVQAAKTGEILVFTLDKPAGQYYLYKEGMQDLFRVSPPIHKTSLYMAVKKGNTETLNLIENGYAKIPQWEFDAIDRKWYGAPLISTEYLHYIIIFAGAVALVVSGLLVWNRSLIRRVEQRTRELNIELEQRKKTEMELIAAYEELTAMTEELKQNYNELLMSQQALDQARKKLNLLNFIAFTDIQSAVFSLAGFIELEKRSITDEKVLGYNIREEMLIESIETSLNFAKTYQDLGIKPASWQNVEQAFLLGISHINVLNLSRQIHVKGLEIYADPMLERVFYNLMENVINHGKIVTVVTLNYEERDNGMALIFEDNGVGVPNSMKSTIFERKYEERKGIGLFFTREILEITGIVIKETGTEGKGARFEMLVPKNAYRFVNEHDYQTRD